MLVIDDDAAVRDLMQRFLSKEGFRVVTAPGGEEGLRLARELRPDAITLDVMMPGMDGWAVLSALKADPDARRHPGDHAHDRRRPEPRLRARRGGLPHQADRPRAAARRAQASTGATCPVLVVDDDADVRQLLRRMLEPEGYAVVEAENGRAALERLRESSPGRRSCST